MKTGKTAKDIFAPTTTTAAKATDKGPGRPATHDEPWTKVTVVLFDRQIVWLDRLAADIRAATGSAISRAEIIRALIDAATAADLDLTRAGSEAELKTLVAKKLA